MEKMAPGRTVRGVLCAIIMFLSSSLGQIFLAGWMLPTVFVRHAFYRVWSDTMVGFWEFMTVALMEKLLGIKVVISGDEVRPGERNLIIMNHRTRLDWMYFWSVLVRQSGVNTEKIVLKSELKHIPGAGWAMQAGAFIFLKRRWEQDRAVLSNFVDYFSDLNHKTQILIFPEGTDFTSRTKIRSDEFARKNNLPTYEYVLHPRTTGFTYLAHRLKAAGHLDAVYDVSVGYPCNFPHSEPEFMLGNFPREVHFHIRRYSLEEMPASEEGLRMWCCDRWADKENQLRRFYTDGCFMPGGTAGGGDNDDNDRAAASRQWTLDVQLYVALATWCMFIVVVCWALYHLVIFRWLALAQVTFFLIMGCRGGFEIFQVNFYNKFFTSKRK